MIDPDWGDPCAVLAWIRPQYYKVVAGAQVVTIHDGDQQVTFSQANKNDLAALIARLEADCQGRPRRRAIIAG
jgi:hypothetical protein